jgi:hypothetical protein
MVLAKRIREQYYISLCFTLAALLNLLKKYEEQRRQELFRSIATNSSKEGKKEVNYDIYL